METMRKLKEESEKNGDTIFNQIILCVVQVHNQSESQPTNAMEML